MESDDKCGDILIVSQDEHLRSQAREAYEELGHHVLTAATAEQTIALARSCDPLSRRLTLIDRGDFEDEDLLDLVVQLSALYPPPGAQLPGRKNWIVLLFDLDAPSMDVPEEIVRAGARGMWRKSSGSKQFWENLWREFHGPIEWAPLEPPPSTLQGLIEQAFARMRAQFGPRQRGRKDPK